jgi:hypothetical protein
VAVGTDEETKQGTVGAEDAALAQAIEQAMTLLATCVRNAIFYGIQHAVAREAVQGAVDALQQLLDERPKILLNIKREQFILGNLPLRDPTGVLVPLAEEFGARGVGKLTILPGLKTDELEVLAELLITDPQALELQGEATEILSRRGVTHLLAHWGEIRRLGATYGLDPEIAPALFERLTAAGLKRSAEFWYKEGEAPYATLFEVPGK